MSRRSEACLTPFGIGFIGSRSARPVHYMRGEEPRESIVLEVLFKPIDQSGTAYVSCLTWREVRRARSTVPSVRRGWARQAHVQECRCTAAAARRDGGAMKSERDTNVHQHLLRELRLHTIHRLSGGSDNNDGNNIEDPKEAWRGVLGQVRVELDVVDRALEAREEGDPLAFLVRSIRARLLFAEELLVDQCWDPDNPFETASANDYRRGTGGS
jgi:hypothetical protein